MFTRRSRLLLQATCLAGATGLLAAPALAVSIPEGGAISPDKVYVIHFQVREGCAGSPMDTLEVGIPASVENPLPEAVDGWDVQVLPDTATDDDIASVVRWTGGPLEDGQFKEFGLRARFPDEPGAVLTFPTVQRCGSTEIRWVGPDGETPAPTVRLTERIGQEDLQDLGTVVEELGTQLDKLSKRVGDVDAPKLKSRVTDMEDLLQRVNDRLDELTDRVAALEETAPA